MSSSCRRQVGNESRTNDPGVVSLLERVFQHRQMFGIAPTRIGQRDQLQLGPAQGGPQDALRLVVGELGDRSRS